MEAWISLLTDIGFPAAVTFYLLHRVEGKLNQLIESIYSISIPKKIKKRIFPYEIKWENPLLCYLWKYKHANVRTLLVL